MATIFNIFPEVYGGKQYILIDRKQNSCNLSDALSNNNGFNISKKTIHELTKLYGIIFPTFPPENYRKIYKDFVTTGLSDIPWNKCIPKEKYKQLLIEYANIVVDLIEKEPNIIYYHDYYSRHIDLVLSKLLPSRINIAKLAAFIHENYITQGNNVLKSFIPTATFSSNKNSVLDPPIYSISDTVTGRLKIMSGPQILSLKKEYRSIITSRFGPENGNIWYLDYASLEPRVLLYINGKNAASEDVYEDIRTEFFKEEEENKLPRHLIKLAVISIIYGQSRKQAEKQLKQYISKPNDFIEELRMWFGVPELQKKLTEEATKSDWRQITNYYGRPIFLDKDTKPYVLINYYIQSTSVDVALLGFSQIIARLYKNTELLEYIKPLFVLHDALILDIHKEAAHVIPKLELLGSTNIIGFKSHDFFLKGNKLV